MAGFDNYRSKEDWENQIDLEFFSHLLKEAEKAGDQKEIHRVRTIIGAILLFMKNLFGTA